MGGIFGRKSNTTNTTPKISSLQLQTSCLGKPEPWIFGTNRVAPNIIQYDNFQAHARQEGGGGGKGGGQKQSGTTTYSYTAAIIMALCSGTINTIGKCWKGKEQSTLATLKLDLYTGSTTQNAHPYWTSNYPAKALAYRGTAYVASASYDLGDNASLDNHSFEVKTLTAINTNVPDANIKDTIVTLLTDKQKGVGLDSSQIADLTQFNNFCLANGLWVSPVYEEQNPAYELIKTLLDIGYSDCIYSDGLFKIVPYSDVSYTGTYATYTANRPVVYNLTEDDYINNGLDSVIVKRKSLSEAYNHVQIKYKDRANDYNDAMAEAKDQADIEQYGLKTLEAVELPMICDANVAQKVADFKLQRYLSIRNEYTFSLPLKYILLEPLDIVNLNYDALGLVNVPVLITEIEESDNVLNITAEQYPSGTTKASIQPTAPTNGYTPDFGISAGNTNIPTLFEPPLALSTEPQLWLATAGGSNWGGCQVWVSLDNVNYSNIGSLNQPSRYGSLYQSLSTGAIIDTSSQLFIDVSASNATINAGSQTDAQNLATLCYADGEYLAYANVLLTGLNKYRLSYLVRGAYGSTISSHNTGTPFIRLDDNIFKFTYAKDWVGKQIYIKLLSFNKFGSAMQNLSEVTTTSYTLQGANLPAPANFRFEKAWSGEDAMLAWDTVDGAVSYDVQVIAGSPATAKRDIIGLTNPKYTYTVDQMLLDGGAWRTLIFKVRAKSITGKISQWVQITADNPQIGALTGLNIDSGFKAAYFKCNRPAENDFAGIIIWISTTSPVSTVDANKVYDGESNFATLTKLANGTAFDSGITYYLKCAGYDAFGKDSLTISSELSFTVQNITLGANSITQTMITDGAISTPKLAANAVTADKILANTITGDKLLANTITGDKIQANAINSTHIQAGTIQADKLQVGFGANLLDDPALVNASFWQFFNINSASHYKFDQYTAGSEPIAIDDPYCKTLVLYRDASPWQSYLIYAQNANLIPVNSNNTYIFSVYVQSYKSVSSIGLQSFDINKSFTGSQFTILDSYSSYSNDGGSSFTGGKIIENYTRIWIKFKPNASTKYILTLFNHTPISGSSLNTLLISYFYKPKLEECLVNQALPSPWDAGGSSVIGAGNIKTDKLSAITANLGFINATDGININSKFIVNSDGTITIQSAATGQRLVISNSTVSVYDSSGVLRVRMGIW